MSVVVAVGGTVAAGRALTVGRMLCCRPLLEVAASEAPASPIGALPIAAEVAAKVAAATTATVMADASIMASATVGVPLARLAGG
jgi:hypothetical protein